MRWLVVFGFLMLNGCGLVFQGTNQTIPLLTEPPGATIHFGENVARTSPDTVTIPRRGEACRVFRASKEGYRPACQLVDCAPPRWIKTLDSIPAALPLAIDAAFGTMQNCDVGPLKLEKLEPGAVDYSLPSDADIIEVYRLTRIDWCGMPYLHDNAFVKRAAPIVVTAGPLQRPYRELGTVEIGKSGFDVTRGYTIDSGVGVAISRAERRFSKATPSEVDALLRVQALRLYGDKVNAVINVTYQSNPSNDVFGTGLAVQFTGSTGSVDARLREIGRLRDEGLIDGKEYDQKRAAILDAL